MTCGLLFSPKKKMGFFVDLADKIQSEKVKK